MRRAAWSLSLFAVSTVGVALAAPVRGQTPAAPAASAASLPTPIALTAIPTTPAGDALRAWLEAFNSGDSARITAFARTYDPQMPIDVMLGFRQRTGGFDLLSIERSEPRHI